MVVGSGARRAIVIGGGVVGLCIARELARAELDVVVLEAAHCGSGASHGNGGWVTPSLSTPLAAPGAIRSALTWAFRPGSPFTVRPRLELAELTWFGRFLRSCSHSRSHAGFESLLRLNARTLSEYDGLRGDGVEFEMHETGLVFAARTPHGLEHAVELSRLLRTAGYPGIGEPLDGDELRQLEPEFSPSVLGGFLADRERHVRPDTLVRGLAAWLQRSGVEIREGCEVAEVAAGSRHKWVVRTSRGDCLAADEVVVAAGPATLQIVSDQLDRRARLLPAKGYSITASLGDRSPRRAAYLIESRVGCSPFRDAVRLAGTLELGARGTSISARRLAAVSDAAGRYYVDWQPQSDSTVWAGLRTVAADALPVIGPVPGHRGLYVASGHGLLGVTLAPATAASLVPLITEGRAVPELRPFRLDRFGPVLSVKRRRRQRRSLGLET